MNKKELGDEGERRVCTMLQEHGHTIVGRNMHTRYGELDVVSLHGRTVHVTEVKTRRGSRVGLGAEAVSYKKRYKITRSIFDLQNRKRLPRYRLRIHVAEVLLDQRRQRWQVRFIQDINM